MRSACLQIPQYGDAIPLGRNMLLTTCHEPGVRNSQAAPVQNIPVSGAFRGRSCLTCEG